MNYRGCRKRNQPTGSGAGESAIRRIVNLRLKGNGIFWDIKNTEGLLFLRCQSVAGRWTKFMQALIPPREQWREGDASTAWLRAA